MNDRFARGMLAGIIAGLPTLVGESFASDSTLHWAGLHGHEHLHPGREPSNGSYHSRRICCPGAAPFFSYLILLWYIGIC